MNSIQMTCRLTFSQEALIAQWSECQTRSQVLAPARTTGEFSSPESTSVLTLTLASVQPCVMVVAHKKIQVTLPKVQVAGYS